jgi:hypothetical protein
MSQFTARATTLDDLKFIEEITTVANAAYNTHGKSQ